MDDRWCERDLLGGTVTKIWKGGCGAVRYEVNCSILKGMKFAANFPTCLKHVVIFIQQLSRPDSGHDNGNGVRRERTPLEKVSD